MSSIRSYSRRAGSLFAVAALVLATITPGLVPSFASAAQITERSIELSSASADADNVTYKLTFTPAAPAGALVIDFCQNSPLLEAECTAPAGFTVASAAMTAATSVTDEDANTLIIEEGILAEETEFEITGVNNPTADGALYARLTTYTDLATANTQYVDAENVGDPIDSGSVAISITDTIAVSGAVLESMTFCVAGPTMVNDEPTATPIGPNCTGTLPAPTLELGKKTGEIVALDSSELSTGSLYSQLSTNASSGAIVNLKSNAFNCGGLLRAGDTSACDIQPALVGDIAAGQAKFGAKVNPATANLEGLTGYNNATYVLNYAQDQLSGVTSTYGDPFFTTKGATVSDENLEIIFGASVSSSTPAGLYSAQLSLIATGKF